MLTKVGKNEPADELTYAIVSSTDDQKEVVNQIGNSAQVITRYAQRANEGTQNTAAAASKLNQLSSSLHQSIDRFQV